MCGISGILLKEEGPLGRFLVEMLDACQHRGPDSTGFALYGSLLVEKVKVRLLFPEEAGERAVGGYLESFTSLTARMGCSVSRTSVRSGQATLELSRPGDLLEFCYEAERSCEAQIQSVGAQLEIIKGVGSARDVDRSFGVSERTGTHGIGHVRLATESTVSVRGAHPFWAYGFSDTAIVHNGQITNYFRMRRSLEARGYRFRTENDSELIAVYLAQMLDSGRSLEEVLERSTEELDGSFTFLVSTPDGIGYARDPLGAKPLVLLETNEIIALASEEVSLQRLFPGRLLPTCEPAPGTFKTWRKSTAAVLT